MVRLAGFKYWQIVKKLKKLGFEFDRQAAVLTKSGLTLRYPHKIRPLWLPRSGVGASSDAPAS